MNVSSLSWHWMAGAPLSGEVARSYLSQYVNKASNHCPDLEEMTACMEGRVGEEKKDEDA